MRRTAQFAAKLVVALGVLLNGLNPAMAGSPEPRDGSMIARMAMPGMDMGSSNGAPAKQMPCGGMDCGCCIGGACAMPAVVQAARDICPSWSPGKVGQDDAFLTGITFPPDIRPPIASATSA